MVSGSGHEEARVVEVTIMRDRSSCGGPDWCGIRVRPGHGSRAGRRSDGMDVRGGLGRVERDGWRGHVGVSPGLGERCAMSMVTPLLPLSSASGIRTGESHSGGG